MFSQPYVAEYRRLGFAVVKNVFTSEEVSSIRNSATVALTKAQDLAEAGYPHQSVDIRQNHNGTLYPAISFWPALISPYLEKIRCDERLVQIVTNILGSEVKQLNNQFYFHLAGEDDSFNWHQDIMFRHPLDQYPRIVEEDNYLQTAIIVDKFSKNVSPLFMVPKSYLLGDLRLLSNADGSPNFANLRDKPDMNYPRSTFGLKPKVLRAEPGDVAIWCSLTLHASCPGKRQGSRAYYMNGFAATHNARGWPEYTVKGNVVELDPNKIP